MQSIFLLDAFIPEGTKTQYLQTCSEPVDPEREKTYLFQTCLKRQINSINNSIMKKNIVYTMIVMLLSMVAFGQKGQQVPFGEIQNIANRNAQALWGDAYPAEPIPYYGFDDEIVAWQFNYSIGKEFPETKNLKEQCIAAKLSGDAYNQWGNGQFGRILMSARTDMPVIIEHANMLSFEYAEAARTNQLMQKAI